MLGVFEKTVYLKKGIFFEKNVLSLKYNEVGLKLYNSCFFNEFFWNISNATKMSFVILILYQFFSHKRNGVWLLIKTIHKSCLMDSRTT